MSMILCAKCGALCDSDAFPEGFYRKEASEPSDDFLCESCIEGLFDTLDKISKYNQGD
jgi:hypothetical protein